MSEPAKKRARKEDDDDDDCERARLLSIWEVVSEELRSRVQDGDEWCIDFLAKQFPADEYGSKGSVSAHCVFCHKAFDPRLPNPCSIEHEFDDGDQYQRRPPRYLYTCQRCDASEDAEEDTYPGGYCQSGVCSEDIEDRIMQRWFGDRDDLDDCLVCVAKLHQAGEKYKDSDDEESDKEESEDEEKNSVVEVIVIDDD